MEPKKVDKFKAMISVKLVSFGFHTVFVGGLVYCTEPHVSVAVLVLTSKLVLCFTLLFVLHFKNHTKLFMTRQVLSQDTFCTA